MAMIKWSLLFVTVVLASYLVKVKCQYESQQQTFQQIVKKTIEKMQRQIKTAQNQRVREQAQKQRRASELEQRKTKAHKQTQKKKSPKIHQKKIKILQQVQKQRNLQQGWKQKIALGHKLQESQIRKQIGQFSYQLMLYVQNRSEVKVLNRAMFLKFIKKNAPKYLALITARQFSNIPAVGILSGIGLTVYRVAYGQYELAGAQFASGVLSTFVPGSAIPFIFTIVAADIIIQLRKQGIIQ